MLPNYLHIASFPVIRSSNFHLTIHIAVLKIWGAWYYCWRAILTTIVLVRTLPWLKQPETWCKAHAFRARFSRLLLGITLIRPRPVGRQHIDWSQNYIVCANHTSNLDIFLMNRLLHGCASFMGKQELSNIPLMGVTFRTLDVGVDRSNPRAAARSFLRGKQALAEGRHLIIFPEGGIGDDPEELRPFMAGAFKLAVKSGCPVLPMSIVKAHQRVPELRWGARPGTVRVIFHQPVFPDGKNEQEMMDEVRAKIEAGL